MKRRGGSSKASKLSTKRSNETIWFCDCFFFHHANEILERGLYNDAIKPGSIVVDETDIVDDDAVDFPFFVDEVGLLSNIGQFSKKVVARFAAVRSRSKRSERGKQ
jgi:hypothetical protein